MACRCCVRPVHRNAPPQEYGCSIPRYWKNPDLRGDVTWSPTAARLSKLRQAHHRFIIVASRWKNITLQRLAHAISYADVLIRTGCKSVEATGRKQEDTFREVRGSHAQREGGKGLLGGREQDSVGCRKHDLSMLNLTHRSEILEAGREKTERVV